MSHAYLCLLLAFSSLSPAASVAVYQMARTDEKLGRMQQQISELQTSVTQLREEVNRLRSKALKVVCKPNWMKVVLNESLAFCMFASAYAETWVEAGRQCDRENSTLLSFGGEVNHARQLEAAVRHTLSFARLRGGFWLALRYKDSRLRWRDGRATGPTRWQTQLIQFFTQPCGVLFLHSRLWSFDDCRSHFRWICIRQPQD